MASKGDLAARFQMEINLLESLKTEADAANGIQKVKHSAEPMVRLRQMLETHPPRLIDLLQISHSDEHILHLACVARQALHVTMPVMASCCLAKDEVLRDRSTKMAEFYVANPGAGNCGFRGLSLFIDTVIVSPAESVTKAQLFLRLIQAIRRSDREVNGHRLIGELTINTFFFSCRGIDFDRGMSEAWEENARYKQKVLALADRSCLLADAIYTDARMTEDPLSQLQDTAVILA